jgi:hypothetical protein
MEIDNQNDASITNGKETQSIWQGFLSIVHKYHKN